MSEETKTKKLRLYKFASEFNLSTETLMDFLQKKGYDAKTHMALLTDEMLADIYTFFKKDIEKAEKHYKKISEFQKKHGDKPEPAQEKEEVKEIDERAAEEVRIIDVSAEEAKTEEAETLPESEVIEESVAETALEDETAVEEETPVNGSAPEKQEIRDERGVFKTKAEREIEERKKRSHNCRQNGFNNRETKRI